MVGAPPLPLPRLLVLVVGLPSALLVFVEALRFFGVAGVGVDPGTVMPVVREAALAVLLRNFFLALL